MPRPYRLISGTCLALGLAGAPGLLSQTPGRCEVKATQRPAEVGCYLIDSLSIGEPPSPAWWHLYAYPSLSEAESSRAPNSLAVEALGRNWLLAIAPRDWTPSSGRRVAVIGPLGVTAGVSYVAHYAQSTLVPGLRTLVHRHPGPEAFYVLEGAQCVETAAGKVVTGPGESATSEARTWMQLSHSGTDTLRSLVLILHEAGQPVTDRSPQHDWKPGNLCAQ